MSTLDSFWMGLNEIGSLETHHVVRISRVRWRNHDRYLLLVRTLPSAEHKTAVAADTTMRRCMTHGEADYIGRKAEAVLNFK
jgi:hypothetical protein